MRLAILFAAATLLTALPSAAQRERGELQLEVRDPQGAILAASGELASAGNQFELKFQVADDGRYVAHDLPFGIYRLEIAHEGFIPSTQLVEIRSTIPQQVHITLGLTPVETKLRVEDAATLVDPSRTGAVYVIGAQTVHEALPAQPGRAIFSMVDTQPGWLYEANGVLHPRGSEYAVQFVLDGIPLTENRSPAFAPPFEAENIESMRVLTANFPAEYGRKLGGVVEITSQKNTPAGLHGEFETEGGSFSTLSGQAALSYTDEKNKLAASADGFHTDRYLDAPALQNFTNRGNASGFTASYDRDLSANSRLFLTLARHSVRFLVPNELIQQQAGQRQDASDQETSGQAHYTQTFSPELLVSIAASVRDSTALLSSNELSVPIVVSQDRGYREGYVRADLAGHRGRNEWKAGVGGLFNPVHENLQYRITDPSQFDSGTRMQFQFNERRWDVESSAYVQDQLRVGNWNLSAGLRFDEYKFAVTKSAWSPRIGVSRFFPSMNLLVHGSYDRVFQTPALENLLLASSAQLDSISNAVLRLPVLPGRANYYEAGFTKSFAGKLRIEGNVFRRNFRNFSDDDTLLDTGVSFPIAFANAQIYGEEVQIAIPRWGKFSGFVSYSNQTGVGQGPLTGGLFLGDQLTGVSDTSRFPISQDQRNTLRGHLRFQPSERFWLASTVEYGSGLPVNMSSSADVEFLQSQYGAGIVSRINFEAGRVDPNFSVDAAAGATVWHKEAKDISIQLEGHNLTNRLNVLNFASLFSGTAIAVPRSVTARLKLTF